MVPKRQTLSDHLFEQLLVLKANNVDWKAEGKS